MLIIWMLPAVTKAIQEVTNAKGWKVRVQVWVIYARVGNYLNKTFQSPIRLIVKTNC